MDNSVSPTEARRRSIIIGILSFSVAGFVCFVALSFLRLAPLLWAIACTLAMIVSRGSRRILKFSMVIGCVVLIFSPVEVSLIDAPGPPHLARLVMGLPGEDLLRRADRGDIVLGGCIVSGYEPRWLLVW